MAQRPGIIDLAKQVAGAMVVTEPVVPIGWAQAEDDKGIPIYLVAVVMGEANVNLVAETLERLKDKAVPVDIFDGTRGQPIKL